MRRAFLPIFIAIVVLFVVGGYVLSLLFGKTRHYQKVEIPAAYLETSDTSRFSVTPFTLKRDFPDDSVLIFFPKQERHSQVYVYDQANYNRLLYGDHHGIPVFLPDLDGLTAMFGRSVVNLSGFPAGKYYVHLTAYDFGGFLQFNLSDSLR